MMGTPPELESLNSMIRIAKIIVLVFMVLELLAGIGVIIALAFLGLGFFGGFFLIGFVIQLIIYLQIGGIQALIAQGQYARAKEKTLIWMILGLIFGLLPGIFLLLAYLKFDPVITWSRSMGPGAQPGWGAPGQPAPSWGQPQAQAWGQPSMGAQPAQPSGWSAPPAAQPAQPAAWSQPAQPAPAATWSPPAQSAPPTPPPAPAPAATMCPRCNKPATWVAQYNRWYCYSCAQYV